MATAPAFGTFDVNNIASVMAGMSQQSVPEVNSEPTVEPPLSLFKSIAVPMIGRSVPVIPLHPRTKIAFKTNWTELASTDPVWIDMWDMENPDYNGAACAFARLDGTWFLDADDPSIWKRIENETGKTIPVTFKVCSSGEKRHLYFHQTAASIALGNQGGKDTDGKESWSARINNRYVVAANSIHPDTGEAYTVVDDSPILEAPDWLVEWLKDNAHDSAKNNPNGVRVNASPDGPPIPRGSHDNELFRIACMLRGAGMDREQILENLIGICEKRCVDHGADYIDMCERKTDQAIKYPVTPAPSIPLLGGRTAEQLQAAKEEQDKREEEESRREQQAIEEVQARARREQSARNGGETPIGRTMLFVQGDTIKPKRLEWLWPGRILAGKLNVFSGEPGVGKGMTMVDLAARLTQHLDFPDCKNELGGPKDVVFMSSEDDAEDTLVPRLIVAGADMKRIHFAQISDNSTGTLEEGIICLDRDLPCLEEMVKRNPDIVLIIPDPIIAFLGDADSNKDKDIRPIYSKMTAFAKRLNVAWLFINHWNKNQTASSINRTSGAKTMVSAPRATWMFGVSPDDPNKYLMMKGKGNLTGNKTKTLSYTIEPVLYDFQDGLPIDPNGVGRLVWGGETEDNCEDVLKDQNDPKLRHNAKAEVGSSRVDLQACKLEYSIVSPK